jgi:uncharacterized lipoprotein YmbA
MNTLSKSTVGILLISLLGGCVNFEPVPDMTRFYVMNGPVRDAISTTRASFTITDVQIADYLDNSQVVRRKSSNEVTYLSGHRWAGQIEDQVRQVAVQALEQTQQEGYVSTDPGTPADHKVFLSVLQFELVGDDSVAVVIEYSILDTESHQRIASGRVARSSDAQGDVGQRIEILQDTLAKALQEAFTSLK